MPILGNILREKSHTGTGRVLVGLTQRLPAGDQIINEPVVVNGGVHHEPDGLLQVLQVPGGVGTVGAVLVVREYFTPILAGSDLPNVAALRPSTLLRASVSRGLIVEDSVSLELIMKLCVETVETVVLILSKIIGIYVEGIVRGGSIIMQLIHRVPPMSVGCGPFDIISGDTLDIPRGHIIVVLSLPSD